MTTIEEIEEPDYVRDAKQRERNTAIEKWLVLYPELDRAMIDMAITMDEVWRKQYGEDYDAATIIDQFLEEEKKRDAAGTDGPAGSVQAEDPAGGEQRGPAERET